MIENSGYETTSNETLLQKLESLKEDNILFVADYYFVLQTKDHFFFYLNPNYFIGQVKANEMSDSAVYFNYNQNLF
jgi:hypothetical protein